MSRFNQAFLRDKLGGRVYLAAFGKHPAWDDHIGLIGAQTETLALLEDVLYRQGIAGQIAAGKWRGPDGGAKTPAFNHRFVWSRGEQSVVGALWPSVDGKGRGRFPFACCVQSGVRGTAAVQVYLEHAVKVGGQAREASSQPEVQSILECGGRDLSHWKPAPPPAAPLILTSEQAQTATAALRSLVQWAARSHPKFPPSIVDDRNASVRLPALNDQPPVQLWFYGGFLEQLSPAPPIYLLITNADPAGPVDCVLGKPGPEVFFCLGADLEALPVAAPPNPSALPERSQESIDGFLAACATGTLPVAARRRFWQWFT